jgi:hypothetical protein
MKNPGIPILISLFAAVTGASMLARAQAPVIGQGGAAPGPAMIQQGSHWFVAGPSAKLSPTIGSCGTTNAGIIGTDIAGIVRLGDDYNVSPTNFCTIVFANPWPQRPLCVFQAITDTPPQVIIVNEGTDLPYAYFSSGTAAISVLYFCIGHL